MRSALSAIALVLASAIAHAESPGALEARVSNVRSRISFYASTRTYRPVFDLHGWDDVADDLSVLSRQGRWDEMEHRISDEMVEAIAVIGTYDDIGRNVVERYRGICDRVEFSIPVQGPADAERLAAIVADIQNTD